MEICAIKTVIEHIDQLTEIFESSGLLSEGDEYDIHIRESIGSWLAELKDIKQVLSYYLEEYIDLST